MLPVALHSRVFYCAYQAVSLVCYGWYYMAGLGWAGLGCCAWETVTGWRRPCLSCGLSNDVMSSEQ
jgi:hypothetical protein